MNDRNHTGRTIFGLVIVIIGLGILLQQFGVLKFGEIAGNWWPLILILIGLYRLARHTVSVVGGSVLVILGVFFLGKNLDFMTADMPNVFWPVIIVLIGIWVMFGRQSANSSGTASRDSLDHFVMFSGIKTQNYSEDFTGGSVTAIFGGGEIDLRYTKIAAKEISMELTAVFGGIEVKVPENWKVEVTGFPLFGGFDNKTWVRTQNDGDEVPIVKIRCFAMFGGIEIKN